MHTNSKKPLYQIVVDETLHQLSIGTLKVGDRFPPESDYAADLGVSRHTLRQAFAQLESVGVIRRRKRGGTEIIALKPIPRFQLRPVGIYSALGLSKETYLDLTDVSIVDQKNIPEIVRYPSKSSKWVRCTGSRTMQSQLTPFVWVQVYVSDQFSDINVKVGDKPRSIYQLIQNRYGEVMSRVKERFSAEPCSELVGCKLGLSQGTPVLNHTAELFNAGGELLVLANSKYDTSRFKLRTEVSLIDKI